MADYKRAGKKFAEAFAKAGQEAEAAMAAQKAAEDAPKMEAILKSKQAPATTPKGTGLPLMPRDQGMYTPGVEQKDLPRMPMVDKARAEGKTPKYTPRMQDLLDSPTARKKVNTLIEKGQDLGMTEWYGTEPLRQVAMDIGMSQKEFDTFLAQMASASQRNPVDQQNKMGSYLYHLSQTGQFPDDAFLLTNKIKSGKQAAPKGTAIELPPGYGSLAQGDIFSRGKQIAAGDIEGALPPDKKLGTFYRNYQGNLKPVTVDVNAVRGPIIERGDPRWLASKLVEKDDEGNVIATHFPRKDVESGKMSLKQAKERPGFWEAAPSGSEYAGFEDLWQRAAKRYGISPAEAQALGWYGSADVTALKTKPELYIDNLERMIRRTAEQTGENPRKVMEDVLRGKNYLKKDGGNVSKGDYQARLDAMLSKHMGMAKGGAVGDYQSRLDGMIAKHMGMADGGVIDNMTPDMSDSGNMNYGGEYADGGEIKKMPWKAAGGGWAKAAKAIQKAATEAGAAKAPQTAEKDLTNIQDFHTSLMDKAREAAINAKKEMDAFDYKYDKGQRVFTEDSAKRNQAPYEIIERYRHGNKLMWEGEPWTSKKIIDPATGKAKRTPYEPGYRVRGEVGEFILPESAIKGDVEMAQGGAIKSLPWKAAKGGAAKIANAIAKASAEADAMMPAVNRIDMNYKDVTKRVPELTEAAQKVAKGEMSAAEYDALVNQFKPVMPYGFVPAPATTDDAMRALTEPKRAMFGKTNEMAAGEQADLRLDIPAYKDHGVWVNSIHRKDAPTVYGSVSSVKNATMIGAPEKAMKVATGETAKAPFAVIRGEWNPMDEATAVKQAQKYLKHKDWRQVGYDPERHGYFYDRTTMEPILGAEEVIQIGPLVLAKKPRFGAKKEQKFDGGGIAVSSPEEGLTMPSDGPSKTRLMAEILARMAKEQGKEEVASLKKPRALTDLVNRGMIAPLVGAPVDIINMGLEGVDALRDLASGKRVENRLASEKPVGGSEQLKDLMNRFNVTSGEDRPMMETGLSLVSPAGAVKGVAKTGQKATGALGKVNTELNKSGTLSVPLTEAKTATTGTPQGAKYATKQEGPFFRVRPTAADTSKTKGSGTREASGLPVERSVGQGSGETGVGLPQRYSPEEVDRIVADPNLNEPLRIAQQYTKENLGTDFVAPDIPSSSLAKQSAIARTHELALTDSPEYKDAVFSAYARSMPDVLEQAGAKDYDDLMEKAYRQLAKETDAQFQALPFNFSFHRGGEGNYSGTRELLEDIHGNRHMYVFQGGDKHDFLNKVDDATGLNENEKFRAVHDAMGHAIYGNEFGPMGEERAWAIHQQMYSPLARLAMTAETRGQNSLVNYSPLNVNLKDEVAKLREMQIEARRRGDRDGERIATEAIRDAFSGFQFAPQKSILLPPEFTDPKYRGGMPDYIQPLITPAEGTTTQSALTHFSHNPSLTQTDPSKYGSGIKGAEKARLEGTDNPIVPRTYFYAGEPGAVSPEPGLGVNRYRTESESLYDIAQDPLRFRPLARESNRTPYTSKYNAGMRAPEQELTDMERMIREYGYEGYINPQASKPAAVVYTPKQVERRRKGGLAQAKA